MKTLIYFSYGLIAFFIIGICSLAVIGTTKPPTHNCLTPEQERIWKLIEADTMLRKYYFVDISFKAETNARQVYILQKRKQSKQK